ncbi:MAG: 2OG-Fe(II) oxygenase family protein [Rhizobiaceae bacterium]
MGRFPVFDLGAFEAANAAQRRRLGEDVDAICRSTGFLAIANHGVAESVIAAQWAATRAFFDLPAAGKAAAAVLRPGYPYGWLATGAEALARSRGDDTPPDLKESFNGGPAAPPPGMVDADALSFCYAATPFPAEPAGFRQAWQAYYAAMEDLARRIMRLFAVALGLDDDYFEPFIDRPISALRALNYPATDRPLAAGQMRAGAHTDYGSLTILLPQAGSRGLQILSPQGTWIEVEPADGAFVINLGDLMQRWTNDRWRSTLHRVVADGRAERRQSLAFFHQPNWFAEIACLDACLAPGERPKHEPVLSGPYLMGKFRSTTM